MPRKNVLVLLQNAWSGYYHAVESGYSTVELDSIEPRRVWAREDWLAAFHASRSGQRWKKIIEPELDNIDFWFDNTTPLVTSTASGVHPVNPSYVADLFRGRTLLTRRPDAVVACGKQAGLIASKLWRGKLIVMPHPAYRPLTDALLSNVRTTLSAWDFDRVEFTQGRGIVYVGSPPRVLGATTP